MKGSEGRTKAKSHTPEENGSRREPSFQVIVLGCTGGPREDSVTGLLVRSAYTEWRRTSIIAIDAGAHLASIIKILAEQLPLSSDALAPKGHQTILEKGPFAGLKLPHISAGANGLHIFRELVHSFLITHPHLDHLSGLGINTPALEFGREAKAIVALPHTIDAIKTHIFNDVIWPNLSDELDGVGFVTYRRLIEGGNPRLGSGEGRGYVSVCEGISTKCWTVSHGRCKRRGSVSLGHQHSHSGSMNFNTDPFGFPARRISRVSGDDAYIMNAASRQHEMSAQRLGSTPGLASDGGDPHFSGVDSSAFFLRNETDGTEIIVFGDLEPDSLALNPRNHIVWEDAARKFASGSLRAIFIECSYDDTVRDQDLYGHLCPRHLIEELCVLGEKVLAIKMGIRRPDQPSPVGVKKKRKRTERNIASIDLGRAISIADPLTRTPEREYVGRPSSRSRTRIERTPTQTFHFPQLGAIDSTAAEAEPDTPVADRSIITDTSKSESGSMRPPFRLLSEPLKGLSVNIIHVKETLADGPSPTNIILEELKEQGDEAGLGCTFNITKCGEEIWI